MFELIKTLFSLAKPLKCLSDPPLMSASVYEHLTFITSANFLAQKDFPVVSNDIS